MNRIFTPVLLICSFFAQAQTTICGTANENGSVTLTVPPNNVITSIDFASYGTPDGTCNNFTLGACHAANSLSIVEAAFVGQSSASINASNGVFGDPCNGIVKRLYIQAVYSSTLPLVLVSFTAQTTSTSQALLEWTSDQETNTSHFIVEQSVTGQAYETIGTVQAAGSGKHQYNFVTGILNAGATYYFRLKMTDIDGSFQYSPVTRINHVGSAPQLAVFPNPTTGVVTISSYKWQSATISNHIGQVVRRINLIEGTQILDLATLPSGIYFLKADQHSIKFIKR